MVEQPKFYYKVVPMVLEKGVKGMKIRKARYYVSDTLKPGFPVWGVGCSFDYTDDFHGY